MEKKQPHIPDYCCIVPQYLYCVSSYLWSQRGSGGRTKRQSEEEEIRSARGEDGENDGVESELIQTSGGGGWMEGWMAREGGGGSACGASVVFATVCAVRGAFSLCFHPSYSAPCCDVAPGLPLQM